MRFSVDPWSPGYGTSADELDQQSEASEVVLGTEIAAESWRCRTPPASAMTGEPVYLVDGVRRVDANVWVQSEAGPVQGVFASWAAGVVRCGAEARLGEYEIRRGVFASTPTLTAVTTSAGRYDAFQAGGMTSEALWLAVQNEMAHSELRVSQQAVDDAGHGLVVVDGPLRGRTHLASVIGMVKTHHTRYLVNGPASVLAELLPGQRTPAFTITGRFERHSWYVRLPGESPHPYAAVVRCECPTSVAGAELTQLADLTAATLPRYASLPHKDRRAPQNLTPIAGLERRLKHLLGDPRILYRALRQAATSAAR
jgi:hypothetical protein